MHFADIVSNRLLAGHTYDSVYLYKIDADQCEVGYKENLTQHLIFNIT